MRLRKEYCVCKSSEEIASRGAVIRASRLPWLDFGLVLRLESGMSGYVGYDQPTGLQRRAIIVTDW